MKRMEDYVKSHNGWIESPSIIDANVMYDFGKQVLVEEETTAGGYRRRVSQVKWPSMYNLMIKRDSEAPNSSN